MTMLLAVVLLSATPCWAQELVWEVLTHDGAERVFGWYEGLATGAEPAPAVLVLHGGGGSAGRVWDGDDGRAWRRIADDHGLVLVLPNGRADPGDSDAHHWNDCRTGILEPDVATTADDVGFLRAVVGWVAERRPVDLVRIYVTGASNGGMMSFRIAMEASNLIAAAAPIIANLPEPSECRLPSRPVPMLIMNGTEDPLMPWGGGCVVNDRCERGSVLSTAETIDFWVDTNRTGTTPICVQLADLDPDDGSTVEVCRYSGGVAGSEVVLYTVDGGGHSIPGPDELPWWYRLVAGPKNHDISGPEEIWEFFSRHTRRPPDPRHSGARVGG
jgi:polyhydroxybutyrate depolymerase